MRVFPLNLQLFLAAIKLPPLLRLGDCGFEGLMLGDVGLRVVEFLEVELVLPELLVILERVVAHVLLRRVQSKMSSSQLLNSERRYQVFIVALRVLSLALRRSLHAVYHSLIDHYLLLATQSLRLLPLNDGMCTLLSLFSMCGRYSR